MHRTSHRQPRRAQAQGGSDRRAAGAPARCLVTPVRRRERARGWVRGAGTRAQAHRGRAYWSPQTRIGSRSASPIWPMRDRASGPCRGDVVGRPRGRCEQSARADPRAADVEDEVRAIIGDVRERGDAAVSISRDASTRRRDPRGWSWAGEELDEAMAGLPLEVYAGLEMAIANVAKVAGGGDAEDGAVAAGPPGDPAGGAGRLGRRVRPRRCAPYPSTVVMGIVTARAAGVLDVVVGAPPGADGCVDR